MVLVRSRFAERTPSRVSFPKPSAVKAEFLDGSKIDTILRRYGVAAVARSAQAAESLATYGDFSEVPSDLADQIAVSRKAQAYFDGLPSSVRREFGDSFGTFLQQVNDPSQVERMQSLGVFENPAAETQPPATEAPSASASAPAEAPAATA